MAHERLGFVIPKRNFCKFLKDCLGLLNASGKGDNLRLTNTLEDARYSKKQGAMAVL